MEKVRLGYIGCGICARDLHWPALQQLKDRFEIVNVCSRTAAKAEAFAGLVGAPRFCTQVEALLADAEVEAVVINYPFEQNCALTQAAIAAGKHVLVVHPFADTIRAQYQKRGELFTNAPGGVNTLPELASLTVIPAVQGLAGQKTGYDTWFDALAAMEKQMDACDYEVAIIGAGAYGLPLAAHARDTGHVAIQMSGATQLLFGIKGRRWDTHPQISKLYNPAWVRPAPAEQPANKQAVEGGSYW